MQVEVQLESTTKQEPELSALAARRARFALRRLVAFAPQVHIRLSRIAGARGRAERKCEVTLQMQTTGKVVATSRAREWRTAVDDALGRAVRRLIRLWRRSWTGQRQRPRVLLIQR